MRNLLEEKRDASTAWLERTNPLVGMSITDLQNVFDAARGGDTQRLHWIFGEIESVNPTLMVCVDRRASAISNFSWSVSERASMDGGLSNEQKDAAERFLSDIDNFSEALEHLDLAFFRGFAHVQPIWEQDGTVRRIALLDSWNFVHRDDAWYFNPACTGFSARDLVDCRDARLMSVVRANRRHIDYPALGVHVRDAVGNRDWGRFLERHALPKPAVTMHAGATENDRALYLQAAECVENGQVSVWPYGATLTDFAGGSRGVDPFSSFVKHQEETIVRLATGGTLGSIAESGAGTLAGNAQADVWRSIVRRDSGVLARAVMSALVRPYLRQAFPGKPCAVDFAFDFSERPTPKEVFEMQALAKQGGYTIALDELEEATGFTLEKAPDAAPQGPFGGLSLNAAPATPFKTPKTPFKNGSPNPRPQGDGKTAGASEGVLAAFAKDTSKAAEAVKALRDDPTPEKAKALLADLPNLLPDDPALAAVIAEEMAKEFAVTFPNETPADKTPRSGELKRHNGADEAAAVAHPSHGGLKRHGGVGGTALAKEFASVASDSSGATENEEPECVFQFINDDRQKDGRFDMKGSGDKTKGASDTDVETGLERRRRTCQEALDRYNASTDHPNVDDIVNGTVDIRTALAKGFEAQFGGQRIVFFTQEKIGDKYDGRGEFGRIDMLKHILAVRGNMFPVRHNGDQIGFVERLTSKNSNMRHVVTVDRTTGVAVNVMRCSDAYIRKHYK